MNQKFFRMIDLIKNRFSACKIHYITENSDWATQYNGIQIVKNLGKDQVRISSTPRGIRQGVIHYGAIAILPSFKEYLLETAHKTVVTWFHVIDNDPRLDLIPQVDSRVDLWHTACTITKEKLVTAGISEKKIVQIPLGIDLNIFRPRSESDIFAFRRKLGISDEKFIIGSFQKDGNGWGEGESPKLIKGPDIFCNLVEKLSQKYDLHILLTGPARGYVKNRLTKAGISYTHTYFDSVDEVSGYFQICDLYLVTSREEGGPKSILESMACRVPLISTRVGMAPDMIVSGKNGFLVEVGDEDGLYQRAVEMIENRSLRQKMANEALKTVQAYDWKEICGQYKTLLYERLL